MKVIKMIGRGLAILWLLGPIGFIQLLSVQGPGLLAGWLKAFAWLFGLRLWWTGNETPEGMIHLLAETLGQTFVCFGGIVLYLLQHRRRARTAALSAPP